MPETETKNNPVLNSLPDLQGGKMPAIDPKLADEVVQTLLKGGKEAITGVIEMLREVDDGADWKARFILQALVISTGNPGQDPQRRMLATVLLDEAAGSRPAPIGVFLLARLRMIADTDLVPKLIPLMGADNPQLADAAATVLASIGTPAKEPLTGALKSARGRTKEVIENALAQIARGGGL